jgi:hypothetical protein
VKNEFRSGRRLLSIDDFALATVTTRPDKANGQQPYFCELRDNLLRITPAGRRLGPKGRRKGTLRLGEMPALSNGLRQ